MSRCLGFWGWIDGHEFVPRYSTDSETYPDPFKTGMFAKVVNPTPDKVKKTYHGDVCIRCGETVNVPKNNK